MTQCLDPDEDLARGALGSSALFLDVDGTLLEIAETPAAVRVTPGLRQSLERAARRTGGALALVSGRSIPDLDALFAPLELPAVGIHGAEIRTSATRALRAGGYAAKLEPARAELHRLAAAWPGSLVEDKRHALAVHFRHAQAHEEAIAAAMSALADSLGEEFTLMPGKCVLELKPAAFTKASGISALLDEAPFRDRRPIFLGDDYTDESGFELVNDLGGISVRVGTGRATHARYCFESVADVHRWLDSSAFTDGAA